MFFSLTPQLIFFFFFEGGCECGVVSKDYHVQCEIVFLFSGVAVAVVVGGAPVPVGCGYMQVLWYKPARGCHGERISAPSTSPVSVSQSFSITVS